MTEYGPLTEKEYYTLSERNCFTKAEDDIYDGRLKICDIPFEYRSLRMYRVAYRRYPYSRVMKSPPPCGDITPMEVVSNNRAEPQS